MGGIKESTVRDAYALRKAARDVSVSGLDNATEEHSRLYDKASKLLSDEYGRGWTDINSVLTVGLDHDLPAVAVVAALMVLDCIKEEDDEQA